MGAITPSVTSGESIGANDLSRLKLRRFRFSSIANNDTFASYIHSVVTYAIGPGSIGGSNDTVQAVADGYSPSLLAMPKNIKAVFDDIDGTATFTFSVTSGPATNIDLFVWSRF